MYEKQFWNNKTYIRFIADNDIKKRYFYRRKQIDLKRKVIWMHREVWEFYNGPIPEKMSIHHIDGDITNNKIDNLELLSHKEHMQKHVWTEDRYLKQIEHLNKIRPLAVAWHSTPEGIAMNTKISREYHKSIRSNKG